MGIAGTTLWELLEARVAASPDGVAAVNEDGRTLAFADLRRRSVELAAALAERGVGEGTVVCWQLPTRIETLVVTTALSRLGAVQNPIIAIYGPRETAHCVREVEASLFIVPTAWNGVDYEARALTLAAENPALDVLVLDDELPASDPETLPPYRAAPDTVRWIFHTSGTTADPKGVLHTDGSLLAVATAVEDRLGLHADDRNALVFPVAHVGGIMWLFASCLTGLTNITIERFDPAATCAVLSREGVTLASGVVPMLQAFLAEQRKQPGVPLFPEVRAFPGGAMMKSPQLHTDLTTEMCPVGYIGAYGATEAPMAVMIDPADPDSIKVSRDGRPTLGVELRVTDPDDRVLGPGEEGELWLRGPQVTTGYADPALNQGVFDDGWYRTGDLGRVDEDGYLVVTGRLKDIIIRKGENISAMEVEELLQAHPDVAEVAVIGLPDPDTGERCCAVVVPRPGAELTLPDVFAHLDGLGIMRQKIPEQLELTDDLPRTTTGKVQKPALRARYL